MFDGKSFGDEIVGVVRGYMERELAPLQRRIADLETLVAAGVKEGASGRDGKDGASVTVNDVKPVLAELVATAIAAIPTPKDGRDGIDGKDGAAGRDGQSFTRDEAEPVIKEMVASAIAEIPTPKDGRDGRDGIDGRDGLSICSFVLQNDGHLIAVATDGSTKDVGLVAGRDGKDGRDGVDGKDGKDGAPGEKGRDGFSLKDFDSEIKDDGRTLLLSFGSGDTLETHEHALPIVLDRGVWKEAEYQRGDGVTWGGSFWIAQRDTKQDEKPEGSDAWRLAVKRGRDGKDGKDGKNGKDGERGPEGKAGRDGGWK